MNLRKLLRICDWWNSFCPGYDKEKRTHKSREKAVEYSRKADPLYYKTTGKHFTGTYWCPYCGGWHLTTSNKPQSEFKEKQVRDLENAFKLNKGKLRNIPTDKIFYEDLNYDTT